MLGEIQYREFEAIQLVGRDERTVKDRVADKTKALEEAVGLYTKAAELHAAEWATMAAYKIGRGYSDLADEIANQPLFGNEVERMAGRVRALSSADKLYEKAQEYFQRNIDYARKQQYTDEFITASEQGVLEAVFKMGLLIEEIGFIFRDSPIPSVHDEEERKYYKMELEERFLKCLDAAISKYESVVAIARDAGISQSPWLDKANEKIASHTRR
jgi:tetratricopeptide (TPR) repeat protein